MPMREGRSSVRRDASTLLGWRHTRWREVPHPRWSFLSFSSCSGTCYNNSPLIVRVVLGVHTNFPLLRVTSPSLLIPLLFILLFSQVFEDSESERVTRGGRLS